MRRQDDAVAQMLDVLASEIPHKEDLHRCYCEIAERLRGEDLNPKEVERVLRLLRKKVVEFVRVSDALEKWSIYNGR